MMVTIDGLTYWGTEDEIRRIVENPPRKPAIQGVNTNWPDGDYQKNWDGSPKVTCSSGGLN